MMSFGSQLASKIYDIVWGLASDAILSKIKDATEHKKIKEKLEKYLSKELDKNLYVSREEEIDFEGLTNYIRGSLLDDVEDRLFGDEQERELARKKILEKAAVYAKAKTNLSTVRAQNMANDIMEMLKKFWRTQVPREYRMMSGEIVDEINKNTTDQIQQLSKETLSIKKEINEKIDSVAILGLDNNISLLESGNIGAVEDNINTFANGISTKHPLSKYFRFEIHQNKLVSAPITPKAYELYPPRINGIADLRIDGVSRDLWSPNIFDYANRHQLNINMTVRDAEKVLGKIKDPSQVEAESMKGREYIISPKPFAAAFPCSIVGDGKPVINYILLRLIDISDDGVYTITNDEQKGRQFKFVLKFNIKNKKMDFNFSATGFGNRGRLESLKAIKALRQCNDIEIYRLDENNTFIAGRLDNWNYPGENSIEDEISFYENVLDIEKFFNLKLNVPNRIAENQIKQLEYISILIHGGVYKTTWKTLLGNYKIDKNTKNNPLDWVYWEYRFEQELTIGIDLWGSKIELPIVRTYICVKIDAPERFEQKLQVLDVGDTVKITLIPGSVGDKVEDRLISR